MRLFVAVHFSPEIKTVLLSAIEDLRRQSAGNFTRPENLHLTLVFIGESDRISEAKNALSAVQSAPFELTVGGAGKFGDLWWAGIDKNPALNTLAASVRAELTKRNFDIDPKPFRAHITLARELREKNIKLDVSPAAMTVSRISLMRSDRINGKLTYTEVFGKPLDGIG
ncbi:MAG TPA: RNA 2',3'-cyclic phosphodiesterase [Oscillospiraceae bacterium]|nr:RNA 2',3'-cyclic phosphodiesterase [Oscillospiraceae bacterium]HPF56224.1 RNA 2',3'-cyclic phosphodiesterase [Clostridiales bacterium]HPK35364.1 RNA 2',3'-cyclic phosphodiesterase [Oscillospiraceae bacterium]HPR76190.1 RNA 2',3'-cyclic phosphodiesterase [Oscillospiraceae bacterium]